MDNIACPACRSNLYTQNQRGYICMACGFEEVIVREQFRPHYPQPEWRDSEMEHWRQRRIYEQSEVQRESLPALKTPAEYMFTGEQRRLLNESFLRAKNFFNRYGATHDREDLASAEKLLGDCLRYDSFAKNKKPLFDLRDAIKLERLRRIDSDL